MELIAFWQLLALYLRLLTPFCMLLYIFSRLFVSKKINGKNNPKGSFFKIKSRLKRFVMSWWLLKVVLSSILCIMTCINIICMSTTWLVFCLFVCLVFFVGFFFKFIFGRGGVVNRIRPVGCYARQNKSFVGICQLHNV